MPFRLWATFGGHSGIRGVARNRQGQFDFATPKAGSGPCRKPGIRVPCWRDADVGSGFPSNLNPAIQPVTPDDSSLLRMTGWADFGKRLRWRPHGWMSRQGTGCVLAIVFVSLAALLRGGRCLASRADAVSGLLPGSRGSRRARRLWTWNGSHRRVGSLLHAVVRRRSRRISRVRSPWSGCGSRSLSPEERE